MIDLGPLSPYVPPKDNGEEPSDYIKWLEERAEGFYKEHEAQFIKSLRPDDTEGWI